MDSQDTAWRIPSKLAIGVVCVLLSAAISFNVWAVASVYERPTSEQVKELILDKSPYTRDKNLILQSLSDVRQTNIELRKALETNTSTVVELKATVEQWKTRISHDR